MSQTEVTKTNGVQSIFYVLGALALFIGMLVYFQNIIKPFVMAIIIWFIIDKVKSALCRIPFGSRRIPSSAGVVLAVVLILGIFVLIIEALSRNVQSMTTVMPGALDTFKNSFGTLSDGQLNPRFTELTTNALNSFNPSGLIAALADTLTAYVSTFFVVLIYVIFFFIEDANQREKIKKLFPDNHMQLEKLRYNLKKIGGTIQSYIWQKTLISFYTGALSYVVLLVFNVDYAFFWSFLVFILNFIPYIGPLVSSLLPALFAFLFTAELVTILYVFTGLMVIQIILGNFVEPRIMGKGTNLGPVTVIVALAFWGMIWGIAGIVLAIPIASVTVIVLSNIKATRPIAIILSESGDID